MSGVIPIWARSHDHGRLHHDHLHHDHLHHSHLHNDHAHHQLPQVEAGAEQRDQQRLRARTRDRQLKSEIFNTFCPPRAIFLVIDTIISIFCRVLFTIKLYLKRHLNLFQLLNILSFPTSCRFSTGSHFLFANSCKKQTCKKSFSPEICNCLRSIFEGVTLSQYGCLTISVQHQTMMLKQWCPIPWFSN